MKTVALLTLLSAIHMVESEGGKTSKNELQITDICIRDVNRIVRDAGGDWQYKTSDKYDLVKSRGIALIYLCHYGNVYKRKTGKEPTAEVYARIYNGGPDGWKKKSTEAYWKKVSKKQEEIK